MKWNIEYIDGTEEVIKADNAWFGYLGAVRFTNKIIKKRRFWVSSVENKTIAVVSNYKKIVEF